MTLFYASEVIYYLNMTLSTLWMVLCVQIIYFSHQVMIESSPKPVDKSFIGTFFRMLRVRLGRLFGMFRVQPCRTSDEVAYKSFHGRNAKPHGHNRLAP